MKKFLFLLFLPLTLLSQDLKLDHSYISGAPFEVGDTVTIKFNTLDENSSTPYLMMFDYQYNNKLLEKIDHTFKVNSNGTNTSAQTTLYHWDGYKFKILSTYNANDLDNQYLYGWQNRSSVSGDSNSYPSDADWSVERIVIQDGIAIAHNATLIEVRFKVKDRQGTNYSNYEEVTRLNWAKMTPSNTSTLYDVQGMSMKVNLDNQGDVTGVDAGAVTINLNSDAKANYATDFTYAIYEASGTNGKTGNAIKSGNFDANGQIITAASDLTIGKSYYLEIKVNDQANWLDDVLTVADAFLIFKEAIGTQGGGPGGVAGSTTFTYSLQNLLGELNNSGNVDFDDSYQALAHINGVENISEWFTSNTNGSKNVWGRIEQLGVSTNDYYFGQDFIFKVTDDNKTFNYGHALIGDVNFSHSYTPSAEGSTIGGTIAYPRDGEPRYTINALAEPIISNLDITSELVEGEVHVSINLLEEELAGTQFNIKYDNTILTLNNVIFDTGNEMTNFVNHKEEMALVKVGSLDQNGETAIKTGIAYKLIFTPNLALDNTSGLVNFKFNEGVKKDGNIVKFNIQ
tara:strand:+ start:1812 stop:3521 length:1710 start_codon:yes stop_codon:yes gene_type:complete